MKTRVLTGLVLLCIFVPFLCFSHTLAFPFALAVICVFGEYEFLRCIGEGKNHFLTVSTVLWTGGILFYAGFVEALSDFVPTVFAVSGIYMLALFAVSVFRRGRERFSHMAEIYTGVCYILFALFSILMLRRGENGGYIYLLVFFGAWFTDTFAYFTGFLFGRHKLCPEISPKKTVEGSIGGIVLCTLAFLVYGAVLSHAWNVTPNYLVLAVLGVFSSVVSQVGDLLFSLIKREYGIKDYGKIFPGHGGVLDRFDSVLAVSYVFLIFSLLGENIRIFM